MRYISIQKKPTFYSELLMVFINSLYELYQLRNLMVRLKAYTKYNENFFSDISIPYGAIIFTKIKNIF